MLICLDKGTEYSAMNTIDKIPAHKLVFWGRKISNSITKSFQMRINVKRIITQETSSGNGHDVVYLGRIGINKFSGVILDLKPEQEATESFLAFFILRKQQLVTINISGKFLEKFHTLYIVSYGN